MAFRMSATRDAVRVGELIAALAKPVEVGNVIIHLVPAGDPRPILRRVRIDDQVAVALFDGGVGTDEAGRPLFAKRVLGIEVHASPGCIWSIARQQFCFVDLVVAANDRDDVLGRRCSPGTAVKTSVLSICRGEIFR